MQVRNNSFVFEVTPQYWDFYSYIKTSITNIWLTEENLQYNRRQLKTNNIERIECSAAAKGYGALWSSLKVSYRVVIKRDVVMILLRELDLNESENRKAHRLGRRQYVSVVPNFCSHADGYDKLKPYGYLYMAVLMVFRIKCYG